MKRKIYTVLSILFLGTGLCAQNVGIGTATPAASAKLDITDANRGVLVPRVALTATNAAGPVAAPATSLLVYNTATAGLAPVNVTPGYYYNAGTPAAPNWLRFAVGNNNDWTILGNAGTNPTVNFIGTTDNQSFVLRTNNLERMRVLNNGQVVVNNTTPIAGDIFSSYASGTNIAVNGYSTGSGLAIYGQNTSTGSAIQGIATVATAFGVVANNNNASGTGLIANGNNAAAGYATAGSAGAFTANRIGIYSVSLNTNVAVSSTGVMGRDAGGTFTMLNGGAGVTGSGGTGGVGVFAFNSGTGNALYAQNANATSFAVRAINANALGTGLLATGNNVAGTYLVDGSGVAAVGLTIGVAGITTSTTNGILRAGGYFITGNGTTTGAYSYVGARTAGNVNRKIEGTGTVNTIINDLQGNKVLMSAPEAPENLFQDYGQGQLVNGKAYIQLDPIFAKNIIVNEQHPLRVFVQLKGNCKGVYVANESSLGFEVVELDGGISNAKFTYFVTANRADEINEDGTISKYSEERFPQAIGPRAVIESQKMIISNEKDSNLSTLDLK
jgi:hypothetical protein